MDYRRLVIGYWLGRFSFAAIHAFTLYTLRFTPKAPATTPLHATPTLYTISASALASNLSPYRLIYLPFGSVLTQMPKADAGAVQSSASQNRRSVRQNIISSTEGR